EDRLEGSALSEFITPDPHRPPRVRLDPRQERPHLIRRYQGLATVQEGPQVTHHDMGTVLGQTLSALAAVDPDDQAEPAGPTGADTRDPVIEDDGLFRRNVHIPGGCQEHVRGRPATKATFLRL